MSWPDNMPNTRYCPNCGTEVQVEMLYRRRLFRRHLWRVETQCSHCGEGGQLGA